MVNQFEKNLSKLRRAADDIAGYLADAHIGLYKTAVPASEATVKADITAVIANFDGYAEANIDWLAPSIADDGEVEVVGTVPEFRPTGATTPNSIVGAFITANSDDALLFFGNIDNAPVELAATTDALVLTVRYRPLGPTMTISVS